MSKRRYNRIASMLLEDLSKWNQITVGQASSDYRLKYADQQQKRKEKGKRTANAFESICSLSLSSRELMNRFRSDRHLIKSQVNLSDANNEEKDRSFEKSLRNFVLNEEKKFSKYFPKDANGNKIVGQSSNRSDASRENLRLARVKDRQTNFPDSMKERSNRQLKTNIKAMLDYRGDRNQRKSRERIFASNFRSTGEKSENSSNETKKLERRKTKDESFPSSKSKIEENDVFVVRPSRKTDFGPSKRVETSLNRSIEKFNVLVEKFCRILSGKNLLNLKIDRTTSTERENFLDVATQTENAEFSQRNRTEKSFDEFFESKFREKLPLKKNSPFCSRCFSESFLDDRTVREDRTSFSENPINFLSNSAEKQRDRRVKAKVRDFIELKSSSTVVEPNTESTPNFPTSKSNFDKDRTECFAIESDRDEILVFTSDSADENDSLNVRREMSRMSCSLFDHDDLTSSSIEESRALNSRPLHRVEQCRVPLIGFARENQFSNFEKRHAPIRLKQRKISIEKNDSNRFSGRRVKIKTNSSTNSTRNRETESNYNNNCETVGSRSSSLSSASTSNDFNDEQTQLQSVEQTGNHIWTPEFNINPRQNIYSSKRNESISRENIQQHRLDSISSKIDRLNLCIEKIFIDFHAGLLFDDKWENESKEM